MSSEQGNLGFSKRLNWQYHRAGICSQTWCGWIHYLIIKKKRNLPQEQVIYVSASKKCLGKIPSRRETLYVPTTIFSKLVLRNSYIFLMIVYIVSCQVLVHSMERYFIVGKHKWEKQLSNDPVLEETGCITRHNISISLSRNKLTKTVNWICLVLQKYSGHKEVEQGEMPLGMCVHMYSMHKKKGNNKGNIGS